MLHVLLLILKIIGIILLVILGLILLIVLLILFVPVRYKGDTRFKRLDEPDTGESSYEPYALGRITWLLHFVSIVFNYTDGIGYRVKLLGFTLASGGNLEKKKKEKKKKKSGKEEPEAKDEAGEEGTGEEAKEEAAGKTEAEKTGKDTENGSAGKTGENGESGSAGKPGKDTDSESADKPGEDTETGSEDKPGKDEPEDAGIKENGRKKPEENKPGSKNKDNKENKAKKKKKDKKASGKTGKDTETGDGNEPEKQSVVEKIKNIYNKVTDILDDTKIRKAYELVKVQLVKLLKAVFPKKVSGYAKYGFDDPAVTGYISAFLATQYGRLKDLDIEPHFEDNILDGELRFKGRIFLFTVVRIGCKVYFNKNVKYTIKKIKSLQSEE